MNKQSAAGLAILALIFGSVALLSCGEIMIRERITLESAGYIGTPRCLECHVDYEAELAGSPHWRGGHGEDVSDQRCESCHGPGSVHADDMIHEEAGHANLIQFGPDSPFPAIQQDEQCLKCHRSDQKDWPSTLHHLSDVSCSACHQAHGNREGLLAAESPRQLCAGCHQEQAFASELVSHHPSREGSMSCSTCHDSHGTGTPGDLKAPTANDLCLQCHTDKRGPHLWEHPPVAENCMSCHTAHGSMHPKMLKAPAPYLCQQCHSNSRHPGTLYDASGKLTGSAPSNRMFADGCMNCHPMVHGSNHPSGHSLMR